MVNARMVQARGAAKTAGAGRPALHCSSRVPVASPSSSSARGVGAGARWVARATAVPPPSQQEDRVQDKKGITHILICGNRELMVLWNIIQVLDLKVRQLQLRNSKQ